MYGIYCHYSKHWFYQAWLAISREKTRNKKNRRKIDGFRKNCQPEQTKARPYFNLQVNTQKYSQRATRISFAAFASRLRSALSVG